MYLFSQKRFIPTFSYDETREMIERLGFFMGIEIDAIKIALIHKTYGGHPFFIRQVCSNIHKNAGANRPVSVSNKLLEDSMEEFGGQLETYMGDILKNLRKSYPDEYAMLEAIVKGDTSEITEYGREAPDLIDHLIGYGLIEKTSDSLDIRFEAVKLALQRMLVKKTTEDFWKECMLRRTKVEIDIRKELFFESKSMTDAEWTDVLKASLGKSRFDKLESLEPRVLFSRSNSPIYLTDLISLVKSEKLFVYLGSRRSEILNALNVVNSKGRKDSHANEINDGDANEVFSSLSVLEHEFQQPE